MRTILITGIAGFVGSHLVDYLLQESTNNIVGILHPSHEVQHLEQHPRVTLRREDILNVAEIHRFLHEIQPEMIFHLAGLAHVHESWVFRQATIETNFLGTFHLLEGCRKLKSFPKVLLVGSGECYGIVPAQEQPVRESRPLVPSSPYAVSKIGQEMLGIQYAFAENYPVYLTRSFNHTGPRQKESFVCSAFARQIAMAEYGLSPPEMKVGNLVAQKDFSDVRDVVRAYASILEKGRPGEPYNVCSGKAISIQTILETLLKHAPKEFHVEVDPERFRPVDIPLMVGSPEKLQKETGWAPQYEMNTTLLDLLNYWRKKLATDEHRQT